LLKPLAFLYSYLDAGSGETTRKIGPVAGAESAGIVQWRWGWWQEAAVIG
jgi:hypothetical protein